MFVRIYSSINEIDAGAWDAILGRDAAICSHAYLKAVEGSAINDCVYHYPVVYDDTGRVIAHTCVFSITMDMALFARGATLALVHGIRRLFPRFLTIRMLECGTPVALGRQITLRPGENLAQVLSHLVPAVEELAKRSGLKYLLFRDFRQEDLDGFDALSTRGYSALQNLPEAVLEVRWRSFDAYVADMRSSYRRKVRLNLARIADRHIHSELLSNFRHLTDDFVAQWQYIYDNATEYKREILTPAFYRNINTHLPNARALVFYRQDRMIAHCLLLYEDDVLRWMYVGKDGEESEDLYPFMLYEIVRHAIEANMRWIKLGITTYVAKTDLGAEMVPLYMYMKHRTRLFPGLSPWIFRKMTPLPAQIEKSVFKRDITATPPPAVSRA
jgi:predicted N-acyltransferase